MTDSSETIFKIAYDAHYKECDYEKAYAGYHSVLEQFPDSAEGDYARTQLENLERTRDKLRKNRVKHNNPQIQDEPAVILTTAPWLEGYRVVETLEIVTAECAFGMNIFRDFFASVTDFVGGRSASTQTVLRDARKTCLAELKREAAAVGADAVIAVDLDYSEFSGQGKSMLFVVASGTAVKVEKEEW
jgi:uncharacterized protein YbjQ (UPF0145 family)